MPAASDHFQDVLLVCRNGHVITDRLHTSPGRNLTHCDRCGADTLSACPTCGQDLPGAVIIPGMTLVGLRKPPEHCPACGATFPWSGQATPSAVDHWSSLPALLRRLPRVVRQLRNRRGDRPPFRVQDELDLIDLLQAVLLLAFDDVRPENRTPHYAAENRTDLLLTEPTAGEQLALIVKRETDLNELAEQVAEDMAYYRAHPRVRQVMILVYDPQGRLPNPQAAETTLANHPDGPAVRCLIVT